MTREPREAIAELKELEKLFPNFEACHVCLGNALLWADEAQAAEADYRMAKLNPSDPEPYSGLGRIQEKQKNYDAALEEYRTAERLSTGVPHTHEDVGRVLLAKKDFAGAIDKLKQAEVLSPSNWKVHDLYGQALVAAGQNDLAISEFKEAASLDPKQSQVMTELGSALERKATAWEHSNSTGKERSPKQTGGTRLSWANHTIPAPRPKLDIRRRNCASQIMWRL